MSTSTASNLVDANVPRSNQSFIALLTGLAFLWQRPSLVFLAFGSLVLAKIFGPSWAVGSQIYLRFIRPRLSEIEFEDARPPAFSQLMGVVALGFASAAFLLGASAVAWSITLLVTALATLAAAARICVGCLLYERWLAHD